MDAQPGGRRPAAHRCHVRRRGTMQSGQLGGPDVPAARSGGQMLTRQAHGQTVGAWILAQVERHHRRGSELGSGERPHGGVGGWGDLEPGAAGESNGCGHGRALVAWCRRWRRGKAGDPATGWGARWRGALHVTRANAQCPPRVRDPDGASVGRVSRPRAPLRERRWRCGSRVTRGRRDRCPGTRHARCDAGSWHCASWAVRPQPPRSSASAPCPSPW